MSDTPQGSPKQKSITIYLRGTGPLTITSEGWIDAEPLVRDYTAFLNGAEARSGRYDVCEGRFVVVPFAEVVGIDVAGGK